MVIPRASLGITKGPFHDGLHFRTLIARNYKRPWEQNSFEGTSAFSVMDTHSEFVMSKSAPALHLLSVGDAATGKLGLHLAAQGQTDSTIHWQYRSDDVTKEGDAAVAKDALADVVNMLELDAPGAGQERITVTGADGEVLLDWAALRKFGPASTDDIKDTGDRLTLGISFNPEKDYARVFGDFIYYDNRAAIKEIAITVSDPQGKEIKQATTQLDEFAYARAVLQFGNLAPGKYTVELECKDAAGQVLAGRDTSFVKEDLAASYPWWHTTRGSIEKVIAPWTPVTLANKTFGVWGRNMEIGAAGLPAGITTQGQQILAAPGTLVATTADGKQLKASGVHTRTLFDTDYRKTVEVSSQLGDIAVKSEVRVEFDGIYKVTMTLTPKKPTAVKALRIVLPYTEAMAEYVHACTTGIRSGYWLELHPAGQREGVGLQAVVRHHHESGLLHPLHLARLPGRRLVLVRRQRPGLDSQRQSAGHRNSAQRERPGRPRL